MDGASETPPPGAKLPTPAALHAHCLLHYFLQLFWPGSRICRPSCRSCCLLSPRVIRFAANPIPPGVPLDWNVGSLTHDKTTLQLAIWRSTVSACARDIVEPCSTITGWGKFWDRTRPGIRMADAHCFSRALLVALFLTALNLRPSNYWYEWPILHKQNVCHLAIPINNRLYFLGFLIDQSKSTRPTA